MQVVYELSNEPKFLNQYYRLREECYRVDLKLSEFNGSEEAQDRTGRILIVRRGDRLIGGARICNASSLLDAAGAAGTNCGALTASRASASSCTLGSRLFKTSWARSTTMPRRRLSSATGF